MGTELLFGQQGVLRYVEETTPGTTPTDPALLLFSPETQAAGAKITSDVQDSRDIAEHDVHQFYSAKNEYEITATYHLYDVSRYFPFTERKANGAPRSYTLEFEPDQDATTNHIYVGRGFACDSTKISATIGGAYVVEAVFKGGVIADPDQVGVTIGTGSRELASAFVDPIRTFASGTVELGGAAWAILVGSIECTVAHGVEPNYDAGAKDPVLGYFSYGNREITGSADISLDDGASEAWARTKALSAHAISINLGAAASESIELTGCVFPETQIEITTDSKTVMSGQSFKARTIAEGVV